MTPRRYAPAPARCSPFPSYACPRRARSIAWARAADIRILGTDETGTRDVGHENLRDPALIVIGNETRGMSAAWLAACDEVVRIPIGGAASSLNAAAAATVLLYEAARQRSEK